jgi:hypothetical protein
LQARYFSGSGYGLADLALLRLVSTIART